MFLADDWFVTLSVCQKYLERERLFTGLFLELLPLLLLLLWLLWCLVACL